MHFDFCILGSSFSGSLLAWILAKAGRSVVLLDRTVHPRFAVGESSTPLGDFLIERIADEFDLSELRPLSRWGSWQRDLPQLRAGKKRGFSYFEHRPGHAFSDGDDHASSWMVAASASDEMSDTHWFRSDVDHWLCMRAAAAGAVVLEDFQQAAMNLSEAKWSVSGKLNGEDVSLSCSFVVDASGGGKTVAEAVGLERLDAQLKTRTGALFGHFSNVDLMNDILKNSHIDTKHDPFNPDDAAQHHVLQQGWMWMLRFAEGTTSVGIVQPTQDWGDSWSLEDPRQQWQAIVDRYPTLAELMQNARLIAPTSANNRPQLGWLPRISRLWSSAAGANWAMLPSSVGVIDPLHSTGIAHALSGVWRLARGLLSSGSPQAKLVNYSRNVVDEVLWIDRLVALCYAAGRDSFQSFRTACSLYFVAAIHAERQLASTGRFADGFLLKNCLQLNQILTATEQQFAELNSRPVSEANRSAARSRLQGWLRDQLQPWNDVGLLDPSLNNRISRSSAPK